MRVDQGWWGVIKVDEGWLGLTCCSWSFHCVSSCRLLQHFSNVSQRRTVGSNVLFLLQEINMTGNSEKFIFISKRERAISTWSPLPVQHFLVYKETQRNAVTHRENLRETQNILRHSRSHQQVFTKCWKALEFKCASRSLLRQVIMFKSASAPPSI